MGEQLDFKIFMADDDQFSLALYERQIRNLGYTDVHTFTHGKDVLQHLDKNPDIIFLDYIMEDMNGVEVLKKIKEYNPLIFVVILSGKGTLDFISEYQEFGAFDYIRKGEQEAQKMTYVLEQITEIQKIL